MYSGAHVRGKRHGYAANGPTRPGSLIFLQLSPGFLTHQMALALNAVAGLRLKLGWV